MPLVLLVSLTAPQLEPPHPDSEHSIFPVSNLPVLLESAGTRGWAPSIRGQIRNRCRSLKVKLWACPAFQRASMDHVPLPRESYLVYLDHSVFRTQYCVLLHFRINWVGSKKYGVTRTAQLTFAPRRYYYVLHTHVGGFPKNKPRWPLEDSLPLCRQLGQRPCRHGHLAIAPSGSIQSII